MKTLRKLEPPDNKVFSYNEIVSYLTHGYWADSGASSRRFDVRSGDTLTVNVDGLVGSPGLVMALTALEKWASVSGLRFQVVDGRADIHFVENNELEAYATSSRQGGFITKSVVNVGTPWLEENGTTLDSYSFQTYIHEIGHALGLGHAGHYNESASYGELRDNQSDNQSDNHYLNDSWQATVMSYFHQEENTHIKASRASIVSPMVADIIAIQSLYGRADVGQGDSNYTFPELSTRRYFTRPDPSLEYSGRAIAFTIYDTSGWDTLDLSASEFNQKIDLRAEIGFQPATFVSDVMGWKGNVLIAPGTIIEAVIGGMKNDDIFGNAAGNRMEGRDGDDRLWGGGGDDELYGGNGTDVAVYRGNSSDYNIIYATTLGGGTTVRDVRGTGDGTDVLYDIEYLVFEGDGVLFDLQDAVRQVGEAVNAALANARAILSGVDGSVLAEVFNDAAIRDELGLAAQRVEALQAAQAVAGAAAAELQVAQLLREEAVSNLDIAAARLARVEHEAAAAVQVATEAQLDADVAAAVAELAEAMRMESLLHGDPVTAALAAAEAARAEAEAAVADAEAARASAEAAAAAAEAGVAELEAQPVHDAAVLAQVRAEFAEAVHASALDHVAALEASVADAVAVLFAVLSEVLAAEDAHAVGDALALLADTPGNAHGLLSETVTAARTASADRSLAGETVIELSRPRIETRDSQAAEPDNDGTFVILLSKPVNDTVTLHFVVSGSATEGVDYASLGGQVTLQAGHQSAEIKVSVFDDNEREGVETVDVTLTHAAGDGAEGVYVDSGISATIVISDDEKPPPELRLLYKVTRLAEDVDTTARVQVADIVLRNAGSGARGLELTGADAALFEMNVEQTELYLRAGATLDFESNPVLDVTARVAVDPDVSGSLTIYVDDVVERDLPPSLHLFVNGTAEDNVVALGSSLDTRTNGSLGADSYVVLPGQTGQVSIEDRSGANALLLDDGVEVVSARLLSGTLLMDLAGEVTEEIEVLAATAYSYTVGTQTGMDWSEFLALVGSGHTVSGLVPTPAAAASTGTLQVFANGNPTADTFAFGYDLAVRSNGGPGDDVYRLTRFQVNDVEISDRSGTNLVRFEEGVEVTGFENLSGTFVLTLANGASVEVGAAFVNEYQVGEGAVMSAAEFQQWVEGESGGFVVAGTGSEGEGVVAELLDFTGEDSPFGFGESVLEIADTVIPADMNDPERVQFNDGDAFAAALGDAHTLAFG